MMEVKWDAQPQRAQLAGYSERQPDRTEKRRFNK
jgi:hypothetical protein